MSWFRREPTPYLSFNCFGCEASYSSPVAADIIAFGRDHQAQCHGDRIASADQPAAVIQVDGTASPELLKALRLSIRKTGGGDVTQALA